jgi:integrase
MQELVRTVKVLKHPNGKSPNWYLRFWEPTADGNGWKEKWRSTKTKLKKEAEQQRRQLEHELGAGRRAQSEITWEDFCSLFLTKHASLKPKATYDFYERSLRFFTVLSKPKLLRDVDHVVLEDFVNERSLEVGSYATVNRDVRHIRAALKWAERRRLISDVPDFGPIFLKEDRKKPTIMPEEDFLAMIAALTPALNLPKRSCGWWRAFLYVSYYLGLRRGETLSLIWHDVIFSKLEVRVQASTSKSRKERTVPIAPEMAEILKEWKAECTGSSPQDYVLDWPFNTYRAIYTDWHLIQDAAEIPEGQHYVPKDCRSTCASELIANAVPTVVVKDFLGHSSVATTETYYINTKPAMRSAANVRRVCRPEEKTTENPS